MPRPTRGRPLDPARDFRDDGGTRAWRNNQAIYGRVIEARQPGIRGAIKRWFNETPLWKQMLQVLILSIVVPASITILPLLALFVLHSAFGWP